MHTELRIANTKVRANFHIMGGVKVGEYPMQAKFAPEKNTDLMVYIPEGKDRNADKKLSLKQSASKGRRSLHSQHTVMKKRREARGGWLEGPHQAKGFIDWSSSFSAKKFLVLRCERQEESM